MTADPIAKLGKVPSSEGFKGADTITTRISFFNNFFYFPPIFPVKSIIMGIVKKIEVGAHNCKLIISQGSFAALSKSFLQNLVQNTDNI